MFLTAVYLFFSSEIKMVEEQVYLTKIFNFPVFASTLSQPETIFNYLYHNSSLNADILHLRFSARIYMIHREFL